MSSKLRTNLAIFLLVTTVVFANVGNFTTTEKPKVTIVLVGGDEVVQEAELTFYQYWGHEYDAINYYEGLQLNVGIILIIGHGTPEGMVFKDQIIPWEQISEALIGSIRFFASCYSANGIIDLYDFGFPGLVDPIVASLTAIMFFTNFLNLFSQNREITDLLFTKYYDRIIQPERTLGVGEYWLNWLNLNFLIPWNVLFKYILGAILTAGITVFIAGGGLVDVASAVSSYLLARFLDDMFWSKIDIPGFIRDFINSVVIIVVSSIIQGVVAAVSGGVSEAFNTMTSKAVTIFANAFKIFLTGSLTSKTGALQGLIMNILAYALDLLTFFFPQFAPDTTIYNADFGSFEWLSFFNWIQSSGSVRIASDFLSLLGDIATWNTFAASLKSLSDSLGSTPGVSAILGAVKSSVAAITATTFINALDGLFRRLIPGYATIAGLRIVLYSSIHIIYFIVPVGHRTYGGITVVNTAVDTDWVYESVPTGGGSGGGSGGARLLLF